ncbi:oxidoreductase [Bacillus pseudomycoides]|uniref:aldo/keto reductase n=1 Tax=Bacillus TaxID=1386 RepID=UPI00037E1175|nr:MULTISPECIES: aldo/keto reductase [Bacillus]MCX2829635.1 aldo/keto reductase [Bacillus sp. DHT2]MDR4916750.1 aldo/keto reductase [Bacillus pseudomycoides]PEK32372.1 oxidoreductase [Bacillus pseudomycoides]PEK67984.1 oxidoreductase [Bacillus pseudomycoides]PEP38620.1 oxidoreductase [Bacillus pseudomycoides]
MERVQITDNLSFSRMIYGLWRLSNWGYTREETLELIEYCLERGITTFDHADIYGGYTCEKLFGDALSLKPSLREKIEIVTKTDIKIVTDGRPNHRVFHYDTSKEHIIHSVEQSLKALQTDFIDVLLLHRPDPLMDPTQVAEAFNILKKDGKVLNFGVSNFKYSQFNLLQSYLDFPLVTNQIELSAYNLENFEDGTLDLCQEKRIPPMAWSPLAGGEIFTSKSEKAIRLRQKISQIQLEIDTNNPDKVLYSWLLAHPAKIMPIIGSGKYDRIDSAIQSLNLNLSRQQWFDIYQSSLGYRLP